jgi:[CysO sulfur-carrier protein]-S-L-cysteine hydrolase
MNISRELLDELVAHALEDPANEVCGVVAVAPGQSQGDGQASPSRAPALPSDGPASPGDGQARAVRVFRATNVHASPLKFEIEPKELLKLSNACDELGKLGAIYHSHVRSPPYPSQTDVNFAANWPGVEWIIVGLAAGDAPEVRSYLIEDGEVREVALEMR